MEFLTGICNFYLLLHILVREVYSQSFTSKPNSPEYQLKGQSASLTWNLNRNGKTVLQIMWFHNNVWVATKPSSGPATVLNSQYQVSGDATLGISNVQTKDDGDFDCQVFFTSGVPPVIKDTAKLVVVVSPTITLKTTTAPTLDEGATRTLLCVASGNPKPTYRWYKDNVKIPEDPNNSNYTITSASRNDAGTYRCEAVVNVPTPGPYSDSYTVQVTVRFRPVHKTNSLSSNKTVVEGRTTTFLCITEAFPTATTYKWFKDGNEISNSQDFETLKISDTQSRLTIKNAKKGSAGQYSCDGTNEVGTGNRKSAFLSVNYAPQQVTVNPNPAVVELGQSLTLTCQADGFPKPSYSWKFNGGAIGDSQNTLQLASAQVLNAGNYTCVATNTFGSAQETRLVNVRYKATVTTFTTGNPDNNAVQGTSVTLTCTANGYPAPTYTIQRTTPSGTTPLAGTSGGRYTIPNVQLTEEDNSYSCVLKNELGDGPSKSLTVNVIVPPSFQSNLPNKQTKTENETVNYACTVQAKPYAQIVWKLGEKNLTGTSYNITTEVAPVQNSKLLRTLSYLTIDKVTWQQNGTFSCVAFNSAGQRRQTTDLEVRYRPVVQSDADHPKNLALPEGQEATFSCKTIGNPPTLSQKWQFNGVDIPGESCSACVTTTFTKASVTQADAGWYSCTGTNSLGEGPPARAQLLIKHPPTITFYQRAFTVNETNDVTMTCRAKGVPQPTITWRKIEDELNCLGEQCIIRNISGKNDGTYRCVARNELGEDWKEITLNVQIRPIISTSTPTSTQIPGAVSQQVDLTCIVSGKPSPSLSWKRKLNGQDLNSLNDEKVKSITKERDTSVLKVTVSAIGEHFYCVAVNLLGSDSQQYTIRERGIPDKPINVDVKSFGDQNSKTVSVIVSWTPGYSGGYDQEFTIHYRVKQSNRDFVEQFVGHPDNYMHTIHGLYPETVYEFSVQASNNIGQSQPSDPKEYKTPESQIPPDRGTVKAFRASDDASIILVEWTIADDKVKTTTVEIQQGGEGSWELVEGASQLKRPVSEFKVSDLKADSSYRFRVDMRRPGESAPAYVYSDTVPAGPIPGAGSDGEPLKGWMIAVIVSLAGLILLGILVLVFYFFKLRKNEHRGTAGKESMYKESTIQRGVKMELEIDEPREMHYMELDDRTRSSFMMDASRQNSPHSTEQYSEYASLDPSSRSWEIPRERVTIEKIVGKGAFGQVAKATVIGLHGGSEKTVVAVKMLKDEATDSEKKDLLSELELMKQLKPHPYVVTLLGCVTKSGPLLVLIEYAPFGNLLGYLRRSRGLNDTYYKDPDIKPQTNLMSEQLIKFAWQIADGMSYLSSKSIIHRDLAARNVLMGEKETCKLTGFGMARDVQQERIYERKTKGPLPVKWTAIEALLYGKYTTKSDVWSYGVLLYEIFTIGGTPYPKVDGTKIIKSLQEGYRMPKPQHVDDDLFAIMTKCWEDDPEKRPTFQSLKNELKEMENQRKRLLNLETYDNRLYESVKDLEA